MLLAEEDYDDGLEMSSTGMSALLSGATYMNTKSSSEIMQLLRLEIEKYAKRNTSVFENSAKTTSRMGKILSAYAQHTPSAISTDVVYVLGPFVYSMSDAEASSCFELMLRAMNFRIRRQKQILGRFLMLFRSRLPELYTHFEEEDLSASDWAVSWLQWLLCRELSSFENCLRLWDSYIAAPDGHGFKLHTFVCLAILETLESELLELEYPELVLSLKHIPRLDMDRIINQAQYLARDFKNQ